ncbi:MAG TPA: DUF1501 domain-containing protein [Planctomycetota bacterium]|nr:DUF1501 domain-containing protein [Planctomycetota bacterium]
MDRRDFLKGAAAGGASLAFRRAGLWGQEAPRPKARGVIWLWMSGGLSQIDTFDPKPGTTNGGPQKAIDTSVPGVQFSELLPRSAEQMKHMAVIRSMNTMEGSRARGTFLMHVGFPAVPGIDFPSIGTVVAHELGRPGNPLPRFVAIDPPVLPSSTLFGEECSPFPLRNADDPIPNLRSLVDAARDRDRLSLLKDQNKEYESGHASDASAQLRDAARQAQDLMTSPLLRAFDYKEEPEAIREAYGERFGINCLLARRLIEAGCPFIEIGVGGWNMHRDIFGNYKRVLPTIDRGFGTLIGDLAERGLLKETLVVLATELGRTPHVNAGKGRDVHACGFSIVLAGAGIRPGCVYGSTGPQGEECIDPVTPSQLFATLYSALGIDPTKRFGLSPESGHDTYVWPAAEPIRKLLR